eukprot:3614199-Rhodomonas_salina.1
MVSQYGMSVRESSRSIRAFWSIREKHTAYQYVKHSSTIRAFWSIGGAYARFGVEPALASDPRRVCLRPLPTVISQPSPLSASSPPNRRLVLPLHLPTVASASPNRQLQSCILPRAVWCCLFARSTGLGPSLA